MQDLHVSLQPGQTVKLVSGRLRLGRVWSGRYGGRTVKCSPHNKAIAAAALPLHHHSHWFRHGRPSTDFVGRAIRCGGPALAAPAYPLHCLVSDDKWGEHCRARSGGYRDSDAALGLNCSQAGLPLVHTQTQTVLLLVQTAPSLPATQTAFLSTFPFPSLVQVHCSATPGIPRYSHIFI